MSAIGNQQTNQQAARARQMEALRRNLGHDLIKCLEDPKVVEVMLNSDSGLWVDEMGVGMRRVGTIDPVRSLSIVNSVAALLGTVVTADQPILECELPLDGSRFEALIPPLVRQPAFTIRKKALLVFTLDDYVVRGIMTKCQKETIEKAIRERENILVAGGTGTGKTTLANAILHSVSVLDPGHRIIIIEDTLELQCVAPNVEFLRTSENTDMTRLLRATMRLRPDRIIVGEVRDASALALLKAWKSSVEHDHPGITGRDNPERMLRRIERTKDREDLHAKFKHEQRGRQSERPFLKNEMRRRHQQERKDLGETLKAGKDEFIQGLKGQGIVGPAAYSLWAREKIIARETLQAQQKQERQGFSVNQPKGQVWRQWLEQEAGKGNESAKSALRGIHYREGRDKQQNCIEGEELDPLKASKKTDRDNTDDQHKITLANLSPEVNEFRQSVIYRDGSGNKRITDEGSRVVVHDKSDGTLATALDLAGQKYGREVYLTGSAEFREEAARECARQGIRVADKDLQILWNQERYDRQPEHENGIVR